MELLNISTSTTTAITTASTASRGGGGFSRCSSSLLSLYHSNYSLFDSSPPRFFSPLKSTTSFNNNKSSSSRNYYSAASADEDDDDELVEVIGIGSRKDSIFNFCSDSSLLSPKLRFWTPISDDSPEMQLQQFTRQEASPIVVKIPSGWQRSSKAVILVATAAYASEQIRVLDFLKSAANQLLVGIIIKPFSFEGRRRHVEVKDLLERLQEHADICIGIETDVLLEKDLVTLDEALKTANSAVLMAMNAISILVSGSKKKFLDSPPDKTEELGVPEIIKLLEDYEQADIGFGTGHDIKTSLKRAVYDCPFYSTGIKNLNGILICILSSSAVIEWSDVNAFLPTFRKSTEFKGQMILSIVHELNLEPNRVLATVVSLGHTKHQASEDSTILSRLSQHFPFIFNILRRHKSEYRDSGEENISEKATVLGMMESPESLEIPDMISSDNETEAYGNYSDEIQAVLRTNSDKLYQFSIPETKEAGFSETTVEASSFYDPNTGGVTSYQRESLIIKNFESIYNGQDDCANDSGGTSVLDRLSVYRLPVGVKPSAELKSSLHINNGHEQEEGLENVISQETRITPVMSSSTPVDAGSKPVLDFINNGSSVSKVNNSIISKREGFLSTRAASMLEGERDSKKKWNPIVEMKYRGGLYKGRCQGGLPEGKGRLSLLDGSIYDGMWRYGKRSGLGTFHFSNGDIFQGSWRDDLMHGKGWLYFQTGDRWFVNFWKGKANGEGRFYSKKGEIFFGQFKDGWRHGHFLCITVDGERYLESWNEGVLISRKQLDADGGT